MNVEQLRQSLNEKWLDYYCDNREWLVQLGVWVNAGGERRPSSSFILATLLILEPRLTQLMPLLAGLNSNPDQIVAALGLNFSPDDKAEAWLEQRAKKQKLLPSRQPRLVDRLIDLEASGENGHHPEPALSDEVTFTPKQTRDKTGDASQAIAHKDEQCTGRHDQPSDWR